MDAATVRDAAAATETEHRLSVLQALRLYRKACLWSVFLSTCIIMEGFDLALLSVLFAYPPFQRRFGRPAPAPGTSGWQLSAAWQAGLINGTLCGQMAGLLLNGIAAERFGYRRTLAAALLAIAALICVPFLARSLPQLLAGEVLLGVPWGAAQTLATTYAAEVCPTPLRAYLTAYSNLCWVLGQLAAAGTLRAALLRDDDWGFRIPFALQWAWPVPLALGVWAAPESPWWLVRRGRLEDAKRSLLRLTDGEGGGFDADKAVAMMAHTTALEEAAAKGTSYADLFRGVNRRRTGIVCAVWAIQTFCGNSLIGYSTYFYVQAGLGVSAAFSMTLGQYALGAAGTLASWPLMARVGRRALYLAGLLAMAAVLLATGLSSLGSSGSSGSNDDDDDDKNAAASASASAAAHWAAGSLLLVYTFIYDCTVGPVCYSLVSELPSTRLRTKSMVVARGAYNAASIASNVVTPRMLNPTAWGWGARCGFFWAASCVACAAWAFWRLPEPSGRTYGELDRLFERGVPARRFASAVLEPEDVEVRPARADKGGGARVTSERLTAALA